MNTHSHSNQNTHAHSNSHPNTTVEDTAEHAAAESHTTDLALSKNPLEEAAYAQMLPLAQAIAPKDVMQVNLDPGAVSFAAVGVAEKMKVHRDVLAQMPLFDIHDFDTLQTAGLALSLAHSDYLIAITPKDSLPELADRGAKIQAEFEAWVPGLAFAGLIDASRFDQLRTPVGFRDRVFSLNAYVRAFRTADWNAIKAKSTLTDAILVEAELIAQRMSAVIGRRDVDPQKIAAMTDMRARMFTLCVRRYDQMRRAAMFIRWNESDADTLVPSLYVKGPRTKPQQQNGVDAPTTNPHPAQAPVGAPITPVAVTQSATTAPHSEVVHAANNGGTAELGMPDSPPFRSA